MDFCFQKSRWGERFGLGTVVDAFNPSTGETDVGESHSRPCEILWGESVCVDLLLVPFCLEQPNMVKTLAIRPQRRVTFGKWAKRRTPLITPVYCLQGFQARPQRRKTQVKPKGIPWISGSQPLGVLNDIFSQGSPMTICISDLYYNS